MVTRVDNLASVRPLLGPGFPIRVQVILLLLVFVCFHSLASIGWHPLVFVRGSTRAALSWRSVLRTVFVCRGRRRAQLAKMRERPTFLESGFPFNAKQERCETAFLNFPRFYFEESVFHQDGH